MSEQKYSFTNDWFKCFSVLLKWFLASQKEHEFHILEIGSHEGQSTVWFIDNALTHPKSSITCIDPYLPDKTSPIDANTLNLFSQNIQNSSFPNKLTHLQKRSAEVLPVFIISNRSFDFVYVDGSHLSWDVLTDAVGAWQLLKPNGILCFDDYFGGTAEQQSQTPWMTPKVGIQAFLSTLDPSTYEMSLAGNQLAVKKLRSAVPL